MYQVERFGRALRDERPRNRRDALARREVAILRVDEEFRHVYSIPFFESCRGSTQLEDVGGEDGNSRGDFVWQRW
jgi:hypothetical protein